MKEKDNTKATLEKNEQAEHQPPPEDSLELMEQVEPVEQAEQVEQMGDRIGLQAEQTQQQKQQLERQAKDTMPQKKETPLSTRLLAVLGILVVLTFFGAMLYAMVDSSNETAKTVMLFLLIPVLGMFFFLRSRKDK